MGWVLNLLGPALGRLPLGMGYALREVVLTGLPRQFLESTGDIWVPQSNSPGVRPSRWLTTDPHFGLRSPEPLMTALPQLPSYINTAYLYKLLPMYMKPAFPKSSLLLVLLRLLVLRHLQKIRVSRLYFDWHFP